MAKESKIPHYRNMKDGPDEVGIALHVSADSAMRKIREFTKGVKRLRKEILKTTKALGKLK